jgi:hypothetical protein
VSAATRRRPQPGARFGRPATTASRRSRPRVNVRRRQPQPSGVGKLLQGLAHKPGVSRGKGRGAGTKGRGAGTKGRRAGAKGPAGAALLFSAAGLAFKNREKLTSMLSRKDKETGAPPVAEPADGPEIRSSFAPPPQQQDAAASRPV